MYAIALIQASDPDCGEVNAHLLNSSEGGMELDAGGNGVVVGGGVGSTLCFI